MRMGRVGHMAHMKKIINSYTVLCLRPECKGAIWEMKAQMTATY